MGQAEEEDKSKGFAEEAVNQHHQHQYGTFQGVSNYPQPSPPPGVYDSSAPHYVHGYHAVPGSFSLLNFDVLIYIFGELRF